MSVRAKTDPPRPPADVIPAGAEWTNDWRETRHIRVENTQDERLIVILTPEMHEKMRKAAGESLDYQVIDGECEVKDPDDDRR